MRLSCYDHCFPKVSHELSLDIIARLGFEAVGLMVREGGLAHTDPAGLPDAADEVAARVADRGLVVDDVFWGPGRDARRTPSNPDPAIRAEEDATYARVLSFARRVGAPGVTILAGDPWPDEAVETTIERAGEVLAHRVELAREQGLRCSFEPALLSIMRTPEDVVRLCELAPGLELTLDYSHYVCQGFSASDLEPLLPSVRHMHARAAAPGRLQVPFEHNTIDFARMLDALGEAGYDGSIAIEYCWDGWQRLNEVDVLSETVILRDHLLPHRALR